MERSRWRRIVGAFILMVGIVLMMAIRFVGGPDDSCEHDTMFNLKGTFADCDARNPPPPAPSDASQKAVAQR